MARTSRLRRVLSDVPEAAPVCQAYLKLGLPPSDTDHRRILAVVAYLES